MVPIDVDVKEAVPGESVTINLGRVFMPTFSAMGDRIMLLVDATIDSIRKGTTEVITEMKDHQRRFFSRSR